MKYFFLLAVSAAAYLSLTPWGGRLALEAVASRNPKMPIGSCPPADAIVVLSGTGVYRSVVPPEETANRIETGLALYRAGRATRIVLTREGAGESEGKQNQRLLVQLGVPPDRILLVGPVFITTDEADAVTAAAASYGWKRIILVTSGYHMTRARRLFEKSSRQKQSALEIIAFPADPGVYKRKEIGAEFRPAIVGWEHTSRATREVIGQLLALL